MMGQHAPSESLFYYSKLDDYIPENHLLRLIDKHVSLVFVRERLKDSYSETGRPSIDPELLLRILLIGYLYGITSERKLVEELRMHRLNRHQTEMTDQVHPTGIVTQIIEAWISCEIDDLTGSSVQRLPEEPERIIELS
jgi:transposase